MRNPWLSAALCFVSLGIAQAQPNVLSQVPEFGQQLVVDEFLKQFNNKSTDEETRLDMLNQFQNSYENIRFPYLNSLGRNDPFHTRQIKTVRIEKHLTTLFAGVTQIATSNMQSPAVSKAALEALTSIDHPHAVKALINIASNAELKDPLRKEAFEGLRANFAHGNADAALYFAKVVDDPASTSAMKAAASGVLKNVTELPIKTLRQLAESPTASVAAPAQTELARLEKADSHFNADDASVLESYKRNVIKQYQSYLKSVEKNSSDVRKQSKQSSTQRANTINANSKEMQAVKKQLADFQKKTIFELAVEDYAVFCQHMKKGSRYKELTAEELNADAAAKQKLIESLPTVSVERVLVDERGIEIDGTREKIEFDTGWLVKYADMIAWHARIEARAAKEKADVIASRLRRISEKGMLEIKQGYLDRLAKEKRGR